MTCMFVVGTGSELRSSASCLELCFEAIIFHDQDPDLRTWARNNRKTHLFYSRTSADPCLHQLQSPVFLEALPGFFFFPSPLPSSPSAEWRRHPELHKDDLPRSECRQTTNRACPIYLASFLGPAEDPFPSLERILLATGWVFVAMTTAVSLES